MKRVRKILLFGLLSAAMLSATTAQAHHSAMMFDFSKCDSITGTVKKLEWVYPHAWLWLVVPKSDGTEDAWGFEFMSPVQAMGLDKRWKKDVIKKGDKVMVKFAPHRDGQQHAGALSTVQIPNGDTLPGTPGLCGLPAR